MGRKYRCGLSVREFQETAKEIEKYKKDVINKVKLLVSALSDRGETIAKVAISDFGAVYTGELKGSIKGVYNAETGVGLVYTDCEWAKFVCFGTGIVGANNPHPEASKHWKYDVNSHGEKGWFYFNEKDNKWHWTKGFPSRPFMWETAEQLRKECSQLAKEVFRK